MGYVAQAKSRYQVKEPPAATAMARTAVAQVRERAKMRSLRTFLTSFQRQFYGKSGRKQGA